MFPVTTHQLWPLALMRFPVCKIPFLVGRIFRPSIQSKLRGKLYSKGHDEKGKNTEKRAPLGMKGKILL